ncbi:MAG: amidohydrolase family protein [Phycisphaerales bacterium]
MSTTPENSIPAVLTPDARPTLIRAGTVVDGAGTCAVPGAVLLRGREVVAAGAPERIGVPADARIVDRPFHAVVPAFVNVHAHLDLTHIGPLPRPARFTDWIGQVRAGRADDPVALRQSVRAGIQASIAGGTAAIGDIAGAESTIPAEALEQSGLLGVSYREYFGAGPRQSAAVERIAAFVAETGERASAAGISPHAPYSCGPAVFRAAAASGRPVATHLAETLAEVDLARDGDGEMVEFLRTIGVWDDALRDGPDPIAGLGQHPIDAVLDWLDGAPAVVAHVNYPEPGHLERLAAAGVTVAYCPRASAYFGHPAPGAAPHAWRDMLAAGVRVALGTDGMPCLDTPGRLSVLDEMRLLFRRDRPDPRQLLAMATVHGAAGLGLPEARFTFAPGPLAGLLAIPVPPAIRGDRWVAALATGGPIEWLLGPG